MKTLSKIKIFPIGKILGIMGAIIGLLISIIGIIAAKILTPEVLANTGVGEVLYAILISIIIYGIAGFLGGVIFAVLYNLITKYTKGIEIELK